MSQKREIRTVTKPKTKTKTDNQEVSERELKMLETKKKIFENQEIKQKMYEDRLLLEKHFLDNGKIDAELKDKLKEVHLSFFQEYDTIYHFPSGPVCLDLSEEHIEFQEEKVKYTTIDKLIEFVTHTDTKGTSLKLNLDKNINDEFFYTYKNFISSFELIDKLIARFNTPPPPTHFKELTFQIWKKETLDSIRTKILFFVGSWMERCHREFDDELLKKLDEFLKVVSKTDQAVLLKKILPSTEKIKEMRESDDKVLTNSIWSISKNPIDTSGKKLISWEPIEIAKQLALIEFELFSKIDPRECFNQAWIKPNREIDSPNIVKMVNWFSFFFDPGLISLVKHFLFSFYRSPISKIEQKF